MKKNIIIQSFSYLGSANLWTAVGWVGSNWVEGISIPSSKVSGNMAARTLWDLVWFNCWFISKKQRNQFSLQNSKKCKYNVSFSVKSHHLNSFRIDILRAKNNKDSKLVKLRNSLRQSNLAQKPVKSKCVNQLSTTDYGITIKIKLLEEIILIWHLKYGIR